jgi:hypothetical protein
LSKFIHLYKFSTEQQRWICVISPCSLTSDGGQTAWRPGPAITGKFDLGVGETISI